MKSVLTLQITLTAALACSWVLSLCGAGFKTTEAFSMSVVHRFPFQSPLPVPLSAMFARSRRGSSQARGDSDDGFTLDDDEDDDDDDDPPFVDIANFSPTLSSFGWNAGRSSPSQRKAMGRSHKSTARIHICTNCGSEFVKWMGRCPTCKEWNTLQEHVVAREELDPFTSAGSSANGYSYPQPQFGSSQLPRRSWLDETLPYGIGSTPIPVTQLYQNARGGNSTTGSVQTPRRRRIWIPDDAELNQVLGGGIMQGSLILIGGDPGVGKSTLLLQTAGSVAALSLPPPEIGMGLPQQASHSSIINGDMGPVWYVSGEENPDQIAARAERLDIHTPQLFLLSEVRADVICNLVAQQMQKSRSNIDYNSVDNAHQSNQVPSLLVIDSIQTMTCDAGGSSSAGGITQVRECVALFLRLAKSTGIPIFLVGHVTKTGDVAGPRTVEHMVDVVLYLEAGDMNLRLLRASKNRFGSSDEVAVYEMTRGRLLPVSDPSSLFLEHRNTMEDVEGCAVAVLLEGMRAIAVEVQSLVTAPSDNKNVGRRTVDGIAYSRLMLLMGVLQKRVGVYLTRQDVYVNIVGRIRLDRSEGNAADLAVSVALVSSLTSIAVRSDTAFVGEVGLLGELRPVQAIEKRLQEARRMGFSRVVSAPEYSSRKGGKQKSPVAGIEWVQCRDLMEAIGAGLEKPLPKRRARKRSSQVGSVSSDQMEEDLGLEIMDDVDDDLF